MQIAIKKWTRLFQSGKSKATKSLKNRIRNTDELLLEHHRVLSSFFSSSSVGGGSLPYFAWYAAANFSLSFASHLKHCDFGRSCSLHQSPFFLKSAATLALHCPQTSSGTPCSAHHQLLCACVVASLSAAGLSVSDTFLHPPATRQNTANNRDSAPLQTLKRMILSLSMNLFGKLSCGSGGSLPPTHSTFSG